MSIGDKPIRPHDWTYETNQSNNVRETVSGLTYREWLIGMLASSGLVDKSVSKNSSVEMIIETADAIINQLDKEVK